MSEDKIIDRRNLFISQMNEIIEKIHNFEDVSKRKKLKETAKRAAYLCLYI